jgi:hypothetical protein
MGFVLSVLYFVTYYLTPRVLFGPLAPYRIELIIAVFLMLVSAPKLMLGSFVLKSPQSLALAGLAMAVFLSVLIGAHWIGGAIQACLAFIPGPLAYFLVCLHCDSKKKLQFLAAIMLFVCLFVIANGSYEMLHGVPVTDTLQPGGSDTPAQIAWNMGSSYLFVMRSDAGEWFYRLRGQGQINDPNDLGQFIICVIPLVFLLWKSGKTLRNVLIVILPVCVLLLGAYLTHSRGALLALMVVAAVAARRRIGTIASVIVAGGLFAASVALQFTGGRDISATAGADRTALWGIALQLFKSHFLFGVGFGRMMDFAENTAHNSVAVCVAELGIFGLLFWSMFLLPAVRDALIIASSGKVTEGQPIAADVDLLLQTTSKTETIDKAEINRMGRLVFLSLLGFLVAGWFLSRAFVMTLFLLGGLVEVVYQMALQRGMVAPRMKLVRVFPYSAGLAICLVLVLYVTLRILNMMH